MILKRSKIEKPHDQNMELRNKKENNIYTKLIGCFTKNGKRSKTTGLLLKSLFEVSKSLDLKASDVIKKIVFALAIIVEIRTVKIRRNVFTVPLPVTSSRRDYLIVKKISKAVVENKSHTNFEKKLAQELLNILKNKNSKAMTERNLVVKEAAKNKSNQHYRW